MKSRWLRALLVMVGIVGALVAGVLTAIFTAERTQAAAPASETRMLMVFEPQDTPAQIE